MGGNRIGMILAWVLSIAAVYMAIELPIGTLHAQRIAVTAPAAAWNQQRVTINVDNVPLVAALQTIAQQAGLVPLFERALIPSQTRVTLHVQDIPVNEAFLEALRGTGLVAHVHQGGNVSIVRAASATAMTGTIIGRVLDGKTQQPLRGAKVGLDGGDYLVETAGDGSYRLSNVGAGSHTIAVKLLGYAKATHTVVVQDNALVTQDVSLELSATPLEQVVVTGTIIPTELKAVPNAITVITAKQIEERGITKIDQLFRGDVPGLFAQNLGSGALFDEVTMFSRGATALSGQSAGVDAILLTNPIKTYVDGVEMANPKYLSQIDPKSIERIEILTGPQASTIYGSNAINGVMQIFTKRGSTSKPQLTLNLLSGFVQNNFSNALTPQHDYSAQLSGIEGRLSYNAGGSWNYMGAWTPAKQLARTGGFGGARIELPTAAGKVTADMTLRRSITQSLQRGNSTQTYTGYQETGWYTNFGNSGLSQPTTRTLAGQTLGLTLSYAPASWWSHELGLGSDASDAETRRTARGYAFGLSDTTLFLQQDHTDRHSLRYASTARIPVASLAQLTITAGADSWQNLTSSMDVSPQTLTGSLTGSPNISRQPGHNTGGFLQTQLGLKDRLFLTYGLRAEWNPGFGKDAQPNYAPRYGVAYAQDVGPVTAKLRGSFGRSTRPPQPKLKVRQTIAENFGSAWSSLSSLFLPYYGGIFDLQLANPELAPEHQQGGEGGLELYLGTRGSLVVTRYNQTVDGLIAQPIADSVRTLVPCTFSPLCVADSRDADGYGYYRQLQYLNIGSIRNQGWELQGSVNVGPFTTRGTYSWTKSRVIGITPRYRAYFANNSQYQSGATFAYLPEHTWALGVTYARGPSSVGLNVMGTGRATNASPDDFFLQSLNPSIRLPQSRLNVSNPYAYINFNTGYALVDLTASHRFTPQVEALLQVQNLADRYTNDRYAAYASIGRQVKFGGRVRTM